jgi:hypothetical protein
MWIFIITGMPLLYTDDDKSSNLKSNFCVSFNLLHPSKPNCITIKSWAIVKGFQQ